MNNISIMIVDDHPIMRNGMATVVGAHPCMVVIAEAGNGPEAIELFRQHKPDVTLMDLRMPGMSGIEVITTIRKEFPSSRFVVLTTYDSDEDIQSALQCGAQAFLLKGMFGEEVLEAIKVVHAGRRYIPKEIAARLVERMVGPNLTPRELEILKLIVKGKSNKEIASDLRISEGTVKWNVNNILSKLGVSDRTHAVTTALQRGIINLE